MALENQNGTNEPPVVEAGEKTSESRRKLVRGVLLGAPILLALKSTPVLACNCKLPSGFSTSGNLSRNGGATCTQPAHNPSYWPSHIGWDKKFTGTGVNLASLVVTAYLDIKANYFVAGVTTQNIVYMWKGTYKPLGATTFWTAAECENYLRYTMGLPLNP
jgi:hypothetical protein